MSDLPNDDELNNVPTDQEVPEDEVSEQKPEASEETPFEPNQPKVNFKQDVELDKPLDADIELAGCVAILRESQRTATAVMEHHSEYMENLDKLENALAKAYAQKGKLVEDEDGNAWFRTLMDTLSVARLDNIGLKASEREDSLWGQGIETNGKLLRGGQPRQSLSAGSHTPDELLSYLTKRAGVGTTFEYPLWHSGIWLRFRSPSLTDIVTMQHELAQKRVQLGTETKGMAFSNTSQALTNIAVNFALQFVIDASVPFKTPADLEAKIDALDAPTVLLGLASTMFPGGLPYATPCVSDVKDCSFIMKAKLNMYALLQVDTLALSKYQVNLMSRRFNKVNDDELAKYKSEHRSGRERVVWFNDIGLRLGTPSLMDQREAGEAWVDSIVEMTQGAFNEPAHGTNRNRYISQLGQTTTARQYAHWIKAILDKDEDSAEGYRVISEDTEVINRFLSDVMSTEDFAESFFEKIKDFIEDSMVSMVAIPSWNCPSCNTPAASKFHERFQHLVPLDMLTLFFMLASRKLS